jgi:hypothetical protein
LGYYGPVNPVFPAEIGLEHAKMDFQLLQIRLIAHIKARVRNGDGTERSLARLSGISQPHMHNVLKGARVFSPELAEVAKRAIFRGAPLRNSRSTAPWGYSTVTSARNIRIRRP